MDRFTGSQGVETMAAGRKLEKALRALPGVRANTHRIGAGFRVYYSGPVARESDMSRLLGGRWPMPAGDPAAEDAALPMPVASGPFVPCVRAGIEPGTLD